MQALSVLARHQLLRRHRPVLIANGAADTLFCPGALGHPCTTATAITQAERGFFPSAASFTAAAIPGAARSRTLSPAAAPATSTIDSWLTTQGA
ncbi:hypothetical protein [Amycolatopsis sp. NPDC050768]|uniref:hypothetical protein n=1 Tax=Amycolatopsis sp. NPDC050768 TaxID=3154839 RepID=UPI0033C3F317